MPNIIIKLSLSINKFKKILKYYYLRSIMIFIFILFFLMTLNARKTIKNTKIFS